MPISVMIEEKLIQFAILKTEDLRRRRRYDQMKNQKREEGFGVKKALRVCVCVH
tara:strand:- start:76 stop:237 length:162 start_codon:yes stop_codon:yes gene_type:complete